MPTDEETSAVSRFRRRGDSETDTAGPQKVRGIVEVNGGDQVLAACHRGLQELLAHRPGTAVIHGVEGEVDATYRDLLVAVS